MLPVVAKSLMQVDHAHRGVVAPFAADPVPAMRRELKLLRIEVEQLRAVERMIGIELELLRGLKDEARQTILECLERIEQLRESRDQWEQETRRLGALMAPNKPRWSVAWWRRRSSRTDVMITGATVMPAVRSHRRLAETRGESRLAEHWRKWLRSVPRPGRIGVGRYSVSLFNLGAIAYRLYLPNAWVEDAARRKKAHVPDESTRAKRERRRSAVPSAM